jgi:hypothetical protein
MMQPYRSSLAIFSAMGAIMSNEAFTIEQRAVEIAKLGAYVPAGRKGENAQNKRKSRHMVVVRAARKARSVKRYKKRIRH